MAVPRARALVVATALVAAFVGAAPAWSATPATTTLPPATSTSTPAPTSAPPSSAGAPASTSSTSSTSSTTSTTAAPGTPVTDLQLNAITAEFLANVQAEVGAAQAALDLAHADLAKAQAADTVAANALAAESQRLEDLDTTQRQQAIALEAARARLRILAVDAYVSGGPAAPVQQLLRSGNINDFARREGYFSAVANAGSDAIAAYGRARETSTRTARSAADALQHAEAEKASADADVLSAQAAVVDATTALTDRQSLLTLTSDAVTTPNTDIPRMVLDAYQRAALTVQAKGCHLAWWGIAGVGKVESDHGRAQDAHLAANGDLVPHIVGVPLTGRNGTTLIQDQNGEFAHAEGPMQFIPSTWARWGEDGNGDGVKDVDNIYDATLGAAMYLCATSKDLQTDDNLQAAYFSYNHSNDYATEVLAYAKVYQVADAAGLVPHPAPEPLWVLAPTTTTSPTTSTTSTTTPHP
ncbi:MAG TPA: lytic murein transglycosylase [Acidimicrobiales bacterium]|nr:lytic murein transglycosylase [Acidimicrobiales bacterium]